MSALTAAVDNLKRNAGFVESTLADFSQADMLARSCVKANHATWQIGHLIVAEARMVNMASPGAVPMPSEEFISKFKKETAGNSDPAFFPNKEQLLAAFKSGREATIAWASKLTDADMDKPVPEPVSRFAPTVAHLIMSIPVHVAMHVGQCQVLRRSLEKPVLF